ncbi:glycosyltransferase family 2 protein [Neobacillus drentensis]|uniref:glycosyltransferase family 2 protein n=1 Tax=Neobacillus drentensis TaxID=220684 RepID=UPI002FFFC4B2
MKVALVMAVYNGEEYLQETLNSILSQTYQPLEIILVNDGSTDSTTEILNAITDQRVKIIHLEVNKGVANGLNVGISQTEAEWIAIHDADDLSLPQRIEEQVNYLKANPDVVAVGSFIQCIAGGNLSDGQKAHMLSNERYKNSILSWEKIREELFKGCPITHGSLLMSKDAFLQAGRYDPQYKIASDYEFFTRLAAVGPVEIVPKVLYKYRISPNSLSNSNVLETSKEFLLSSTKFIRKHCFTGKKGEPVVVVHGTKAGCIAFTKIMQKEGIFHPRINLFLNGRKDMRKSYELYKLGKIDAFIILSNAPVENQLINYLSDKGLKLNKDYFTLWSAL